MYDSGNISRSYRRIRFALHLIAQKLGLWFWVRHSDDNRKQNLGPEVLSEPACVSGRREFDGERGQLSVDKAKLITKN